MEYLTIAEALGLGLLFLSVFYMGVGIGKVRANLQHEEANKNGKIPRHF